MNQQTKNFLTELVCLMEKYEVDFDISETQYGYNGFEADGMEIGVVDPESGYSEYISVKGKYFNWKDFKELLND